MNSRVASPLFVPIGAPSGMDGRRARIDQVARDVQIGIHIRHDDKALFGEDFGRLDGLLIVRQQVFGVAHDLDLDKITAADFAAQPRNAHCLVCVARARGVGQQGHALGDVIQNVGRATLVRAAQRKRDDLRARVVHSGVDQIERILARTQNKAGGEFMPAQNQLVFHVELSPFLSVFVLTGRFCRNTLYIINLLQPHKGLRFLRLALAQQQPQHHGRLLRGAHRNARRHQPDAVRDVACAVPAHIQAAKPPLGVHGVG